MKFLSLVSVLVLVSLQGMASNCPDQYQVMDNTMFQTLPTDKGCMLSVSPRNTYGMVYRNFLFHDSGLFMVFNSFGNGPEDVSAGAREFYFFPRRQELDYTYDAATQRVSVTAPNGKIFVFNTQKTILVSVSGSTFVTDYEVNPGNAGGIEFTKNDGLLLDLGFQLGQSPSQNPGRKITFKDPAGRTCAVKNSEIFKYTADQDVIVRHDDVQLKKFLATRCPALRY